MTKRPCFTSILGLAKVKAPGFRSQPSQTLCDLGKPSPSLHPSEHLDNTPGLLTLTFVQGDPPPLALLS